ncbi:MAG TPA: cupin-like domain-containing protein [Fimbriimonadaceae bacterium]|nr:cupin-like domain-containing protein [Fimbriimonadaceae bacterium]
MAQALAPSSSRTAIPEIDYRSDLSPAAFRQEYVEANKPVILKGAVPEWRNRWTPDLLKEKFGDRLILAERDELYQNQKTRMHIRVDELIDTILSGSLKFRVRASPAAFLAQCPELQADLDRHEFKSRYFPEKVKTLSNFWISPTTNTSVMHHDTFFENLNAMIFGRKNFIFIPPAMTHRIYPHFMNESPVNPLAPDMEKFPKFAGVELQQGTIEAGDILYIPQFWWHFTTALEPCINLNIWTKASRSSVRRVTRTMPLSSRLTYTVLYNDKLYDWFMQNMRSIHKAYSGLLPKKKPAPAMG